MGCATERVPFCVIRRSANYRRRESDEVLCRGSLLAVADIELYLRTFDQPLEALPLKGAVVTKKSSSPSSRAMKPKPLSSLNHLTVPVTRVALLLKVDSSDRNRIETLPEPSDFSFSRGNRPAVGELTLENPP